MKTQAQVAAVLVLAALPGLGAPQFGTPFSDGLVLQRDRAVPVWGTAEPGARVRVTFAGQAKEATADANGDWRVDLDPLPASKEPRELVLAPGAGDGAAVTVSDVLVGEVWLCSGQSNAECPIWGDNPRYRDGWGAMTLRATVKPFVRLAKAGRRWSVKPRRDAPRAVWRKMTPGLYDAFRKGVELPSAVGYYYALELANALDVPIGLVDCSWGGTNIDAWTPRSGYANRPALADVAAYPLKETWNAATDRAGVISGLQQQPTVLWNGIVAAYAPMAIRGFVWYQGCHNSWEPKRYAAKMHALYDGWAKEFENPALEMYFAQLAPWGQNNIAAIQMAQATFAAEEPHAAMAVINDVGNLTDIHPNDKRTVARRLSLHALRRLYGFAEVEDESPTVRGWKTDGPRVTLSFDHAEGFYVYNPDGSVSNGFELAGVDGVFRPARIVNLFETRHWKTGKPEYRGPLVGTNIVLEADGVREPNRVRYLHARPWFGSVYSDAGLPLGAFEIASFTHRPFSLKGTWCSLGTSITWLDTHPGSSRGGMTRGYQSRVQDVVSFDGYVNGGANASVLAEALDKVVKADWYTIEHGINDWGKSTPVGTLADYRAQATNGTFYADYRRLIDRIRALSPSARILLCTPRRGCRFGTYLPAAPGLPKNGIFLKDYVDAVRAIAAEEGFPVIDFYANCAADEELADLSYDDALHPNDKGYQRMAEEVIRVLETQRELAPAAPAGTAPGPGLRGGRGRPRGRVMFWYDVEDYVCDAADEGTLCHARMLTELGVRGNFSLVGFYAQRLVERGRFDVIEALKGHCLGSQTLYHSRHPTICEYTDVADWGAAYRRCLAEESECIGMIKAVFGLDSINLFVPPGTSVTPVAMYAYADRGVTFYGGGLDIFGDSLAERPAWYCNMLHVPYSPASLRDNDTLAKRDLTVIATHPNQLVTAEFWDGVNYAGGNLVPWRQWRQPRLLTPEQQRREREGWREMVAGIVNDRRLTVVTCEDLAREIRPRVAIRRSDVPRLRAAMSRGFEPVEEPSWCVSDVFQAAVAFLRGASSFLPGKAWGFLERPIGVTEPVTVTRADVTAAARALDVRAFLPPQVAVGDRKVGPGDFLVAMLELLDGDAETVTLEPRDQIGPMGRHLPNLPDLKLGQGDWPIYAKSFKDEYVSDRLRWQFWTLRHE